MPERVDSTDPDGVDFGWVMQTTFVLTIVVGAPVVAIASTAVTLPTWAAMASFAVRVGALVWFITAVAVYLYARRKESQEPDVDVETGTDPAEND
ncbi:DUF5822 domain-containing protein [Haloglomus litoreum]|uniref:DUF5822 domain-containing protein n=1 Tax=Haloglomus litoreum TaxID=3034026 RepID=UPI0023E76F16|nr:DUF5822 domain-containing protein [Haloglomus sp. DT116]